MKKYLPLLLFLLLALPGFLLAQTNQYLHFDRSDDYVRLDNGSQYIANTMTFSMAGWFYTDQLAYGQGMIGFRGTNEGFYLIQLSDGTLECRLITNNGFHEYVGPNFTILPGVWQHVAWVYDGSTVGLYIDGILHGNTPASGQITVGNIPFTIGRSILSNLDFYFGGRADEVNVWDKALTATEIQDMMANELTGTEPNLQLYYKFNQGAPCGDNSSITNLTSEVGSGTRDANLIGFALNGGCTSNFDGILQSGFQAISFIGIPNKLTTDPAFNVSATASSGLPITFEIVSGPATISDSTITLTGQAGQVVVAASQYGDATWDSAVAVTKIFEVIDPQENTPNVELRNPLSGSVSVPTLGPIQLAAKVDIDFPELFAVGDVEFVVDSLTIPARDWENGHYTAWWEPAAYGIYDVTVRAFNSFGAQIEETTTVVLTDENFDTSADAFTDVWLNSTISSAEIEAELPVFMGAYDQVIATLDVVCPPGGCDPWDRVSKVELQTHEGEWIEIIRYITPYGVACSHTLDVTDFISALQGKIRFRMEYETFANGFEFNLTLNYRAGTPDYKYSHITPVWHETFDFGNPANLQPVDKQIVAFPANTLASTFKLISSGHGWGENNTNNAAEFFETSHHIWVDGVETFEQHNWMICNPNPDACSPQIGTWYHNRAGFCPGAISPWFDFDMAPFINNGQATLNYFFDRAYEDLCHVNNPNCVEPTTCNDCNDGFNPHLIVASSLINFSDVPFDSVTVSPTANEPLIEDEALFSLYPNPSTGQVRLEVTESMPSATISILNPLGVEVMRVEDANLSNGSYQMNLERLAKGMYLVVLESKLRVSTRKLVLR